MRWYTLLIIETWAKSGVLGYLGMENWKTTFFNDFFRTFFYLFNKNNDIQFKFYIRNISKKTLGIYWTIFFLILINIDGDMSFLINSKNIGKIVPLYGRQFSKLNNFFNKFE